MHSDNAYPSRRRLLFLAGLSSIPIFGLMRGSLRLLAQEEIDEQEKQDKPEKPEKPDKTGFPDGFDAIAVAPQSHRVLFENAMVRVLQVEVAPGTKEPMHHHRWPSVFLVWDSGGRTAHIRITHGDGSVHDVPSRETPVVPGVWRVSWMKPEAMHSIENLETGETAATLPWRPPTIRVEFKFAGFMQ